MITELNERSREILRLIVDSYVQTGEPVGSRTLARLLGRSLSPATIRNVMADLEEMGLLYAPHVSAGRLPTDAGMSVFVQYLMEIGDLNDADRQNIEAQCRAEGRSLPEILEQASALVSGLSSAAGLVIAPTQDKTLRQIDFVQLGPGRVLAVLVAENGGVENRVFETAPEVGVATLQRAANYLNARLAGKSLSQAREQILSEIGAQRAQLDALTQKMVETGLDVWIGASPGGHMVVRGQANLLEDVTALEDIERIRTLLEALESKETMARLLDATENAQGVQILIGAENRLFANTGCSMIISPYRDSQARVVFAVGVIGPTRLNYGRIIPMVNYTTQMIGRLLG